MPATTRPDQRSSRSWRARGAVLLVVCIGLLGACSNGAPSAESAPDGLLALVANADGTTLVGWDDSGEEPIPITLPKGETTWVAAGLAGVLAAALADGTTATSDPVHLGKRLKWRAVKPVGPNGDPDRGPDTFASWEPGGGRYATLSGDLATGDDVRVVLIDPSVSTSFEIPLDRSVVAAPPAWIDRDRFVVVTGDAAEPAATIVDAETGELSDGPPGARLIATSADGRRIATMAGQGAPVVVRDTTAWLGDDGSSIASIEPAGDATTAIGFALDPTGQRLVIAWADRKGAVSLAIHDARADWRRIAQPEIGPARGAVVAWLR
jgi:hypothetical protein